MLFQKNISLKQYTGFKIGGSAKYFLKAEKLKDLIKAIKEAKRLKIPVFILGGGTKLLINDNGFPGLVIKIQTSKFKIKKNKIVSEAGVGLDRLVIASLKAGLTGLEWTIEIPGTVGGAVHGNSGAFGSSISEIVKSVTALNPNNLKIKKYANQQCRFGYRDSVFKHNKDIILLVELQLKKGDPKKSLTVMKEYLKRRRERIPAYFSAGSIFKNLKFPPKANPPTAEKIKIQKLIRQLTDKDKIKGGMVPAAYLIEKCGLKGKRIGGAKISEKHANFIVNFNKAKAKNVSDLINLAKKRVKKKFGINLEEEIICV